MFLSIGGLGRGFRGVGLGGHFDICFLYWNMPELLHMYFLVM